MRNDNIMLDKWAIQSWRRLSHLLLAYATMEMFWIRSWLIIEVETLTNVKGDQWALIIDKIINPIVRYVTYDISYKVYFRNREGVTSAIAVYMAHMLMMKDKSFDLCELLKELLLENIKMSKEQNYPFRFGSFIVCLVMYCLGSLTAKENVIW